DSTGSQLGVITEKRRLRRSIQLTTDQTNDIQTSGSYLKKKSKLSFKVMLEGQWTSGNSTESEVSRNLQRVLTSLLEEARQGLLNLTVHGKDLDFADFVYDPEHKILRCPMGSVFVNQSCVNCPVGTFYNTTSMECLGCPRGSFQPEEGQSTCVICPTGSSTVAPRAKSANDCRAHCSPGSFSSSGLEPCESCSRGFYQTEASALACNPCSPGTTTARRGSRRPQDCAEPCPMGHVSDTGLAPCFRCPHHCYQPDPGQSQCLLCPPGLVTLSSGAVSVESCLEHSVAFGNQSDYVDSPRSYLMSDQAVLAYDVCFSGPCQNGGQCVSKNGGSLFGCTCPSGFQGSQCEQRVDLCELNPCLNGGQCLQHADTLKCHCKTGFTGGKCEIDINECASSPCQNQADCVDEIGSYRCLCPVFYSGPTCADMVNDCTQDTCRNGGNCTNTPTGFECVCAQGFNGTICEVDIDECQTLPCLNQGSCTDMPGTYRCDCVQGFTGTSCETETNECEESPCQNQGTCEDLVGSYRCHCVSGFSGNKCEKELIAHYQLHFITPTIMEYAKMSIAQPLSALSLSVWFRTTDDQNQGTFFSYSVPGQPDTLSLTDYANLNLVINGQVARIGARLNDGLWHHFVFTWSSALGDWKAYGDGIIIDQNTDLSKSTSIPGQGVFIVGQEQDSFGGDFSPAETFVGSMTHLNIWDRVLTLQEVDELRFSCEYPTGNVISWLSVQENLHGNIAPQPTSFCEECPAPVKPEFGAAEYTETRPGSYVRFECSAGYERVGSGKIRCLVSSHWEEDTPFCKPITCGNPGSIANGQVLGEDYSFGKQIRFRCGEGFELSGEPILTCEEWGDWDFDIPECQEIQCPLPALSENTVASPSKTRFKRGSNVTFSCKLGSTLHTAHNSVTCQTDGTWDQTLPSCDELHCGPPPSIDNGAPSTPRPEYNVGDSVRYKCKFGYDFNLDAANTKRSIDCLPSGQWESELPVCIPIKCLDPPSIPRAVAEGSGRTVGSIVTYECSSGFQPLPGRRSTIECQENQEWTKTFFNCVPIQCPDPPALSNGSFDPPNGPYLYTMKLVAICNLGYEVTPSNSERTCEANSSWDGVAPRCLPVSCGPPQPVAMATLTLSGGTKYLDTVTVTCDLGFQLEGPAVRTCEASKSWKPSGSVACKPRKCPVPPDIEFGSYGLSGPTEYGSSVQYSCAAGYRLHGERTSTCSEEGIWSHETPTCHLIMCPSPEPPHMGSLNVKSNGYAGQAIYTCAPDYRLNGVSERTCQMDDTWSGEAPTCEPTKCRPPPDLAHGDVEYTNMSPGGLVRHKCNEGYVLVGEFQRICQANLTLSGGPPRCEPVSCGPLQPPLHGSIAHSPDNAIYGAVISFTCNLGYYLSSDGNRSCLSNGSWSGEPPTCVPVECPPKSIPISNGQVNSTERTFGEIQAYSCDSGYQLHGSAVRVCQADGTWDQPEPFCQIIQCPELMIPNGLVNTSERSFSTHVSVSCISHYRLEGPSTIVCDENGEWEGGDPRCINVECSPPVPILNGNVTVINNLTIKHECENGYRLIGKQVQVCDLDGSWVPDIPLCEKITCENLNATDFPNGEIKYVSNNIGDRVNYICNNGYTLRGVPNRKCSGNGDWESSPPVCELVDCGSPPPLLNGTFVGSNYTYGSVLNASCHFGFHIVGMNAVMCQEDGNWSQVPLCEKTTCPSLNFENGTVLVTSYEVLGQAQYQCGNGFQLLSNTSTRECLDSGEWSSHDPVCNIIVCLKPTNLHNTTLIVGSSDGNVDVFDFGEEISYTCPEGFYLSGPDRRTCGSDSTWSGTDPQCSRVICPEPMTPENGWRTGDGVTFESEIYYGCDTGYELLGENNPKCLANGVWSSQNQTCIKISCGEPQTINNANFVVGDESYLWLAHGRYSCDEGYTATGEAEIQCLATKQWSATDFACTIVSCQIITSTNIPNGILVPSIPNPVYGSIVSISCDVGYSLTGSSQITCQSDGTWSHSIPTCAILRCPPLSLANGRVIASSNEYGGVAKHICNVGYVLDGHTSLSCLSTGSWNASQPVCNIVRCPNPPSTLEHGQVVDSKYEYVYGSSSTYRCNNGYELQGSREITCEASGTFSSAPPTCRRVPCPVPSVIANGNMSVKSVRNETSSDQYDVVTYTCSHGYNLLGLSQIECLLGGTWSGISPECTPVLCPSLSPPINGYIVNMDLEFGQSVVFLCDSGYDLKGSDTRVCQADQTWSGELTKCEPKFCGVPPEPFENGIIDGEYVYKTGVFYRCLPGFELIGETYRPCGENGSWAGEVPFCSRLSCPTPPAIENGFKSGPPYEFESEVIYSCTDGYEIQGEATRICQASLVWSGQPPVCLPISCGSPPVLDNGYIEGSSHLFGDILNVSCHRGYRLKGSEIRVCQANKTWSFDDPLCEQILCPPPPLYNKSSRDTEDARDTFPVDFSVSYVCEIGHIMNGSGVKICEQSGQWSGEDIHCYPLSCEPVNSIKYGEVMGNSFTYLSVLDYTCKDGFKLAGNSSSTCTEHGIWSSQPPSCNPIECPSLATAYGSFKMFPGDNSTLLQERNKTGQYIYGDVLSLVCDEGYEPKGPTRRTCLLNGTWSHNYTVCDPVNCSIPRNIDNAVIPNGKNVAYGESISVSCIEGFTLLGASELKCGSDTRWEEPLPRCLLLACGSPPLVPNAYIEGDNFDRGQSIKYYCKPGFHLIGNRYLMCGNNSVWEGFLPVCVLRDCGVLPEIPNAKVIQTGGVTTFGSSSTITCVSGFFHDVDPSIKCGVNGTWEVHPSFECKPVDCGQPPRIQHGTVQVTDTIFGSPAIYSCSVGYYLISSSYMYCEEDGQWVYETPTCKAVDCSTPPTIPHTFSNSLQGTEYTAVVKYHCKIGYSLVDSSADNLTCGAMGIWTAEVTPSCKAIDCGLPPLYPNTMYDLENNHTSYLSHAFYQCDPGYQVKTTLLNEESNGTSSVNVLTCHETGHWIGNPIACEPVDCGTYPDSPDVIYHPDNGTKFGALVFYSCRLGFSKNGPDFLHCEDSGNWSSYSHSCLPIDCGPPYGVDHGTVTFFNTTFDAEAIYNCDSGYNMSRNDTPVSRCLSSGMWSITELPTCWPVDCFAPPTIAYGRAHFNTTTLHSRVIYECVHGYVLNQNSVNEFKCVELGTWEGDTGRSDIPVCQPVQCSSPIVPVNGNVTFSSLTFGARAVFSCMPGYKLEGVAYSECSRNGSWSSDSPTCPPLECPSAPDAGENGLMFAPNVTFGSKAEYSCKKGYKFISDVGISNLSSLFLTCNQDGEWNGTVPICGIVTCDNITVSNGIFSYTGNSFGSSAQLICNEGFTLQGSGITQCDEHGLWVDAKESKCERIQCTNPPNIANGITEFSSLSYQSKAIYKCSYGYRLVGQNALKCTHSGWEGIKPSCVLIVCNIPATIPNAYSNFSSDQPMIVGKIIKYVCNPGFKLKGSDIVGCSPNGKWLPEVPECKPVFCPGPPTLPNYIVLQDTGRYVNATVQFSCIEGYRMVEINDTITTIKCGLDGQWFGKLPSCDLVKCDDNPPSISHATISKTGDTYASKAFYSCDIGYIANGPNELICDNLGRWSESIATDSTSIIRPSCDIIHCGAPPNISDTTYIGSDFSWNQTITYACLDGFDLIGKATSTCLITGNWSPTRFICQVRTCSLPHTIQNGNVRLPLTQTGGLPIPGHLAHFECKQNHRLIGHPVLRCMEAGNWNGSWPECRQINEICSEFANLENTQSIRGGKHYGEKVVLGCVEGYTPRGDMTSTCLQDRTWTLPQGRCQRVFCGKPTPKSGSETSAMVIGWNYYYKDTVRYICRYGHLPSHNPPILTCGATGLWDGQPECTAQCSKSCLNGGRCLGRNVCECLPGWAGSRCQFANCIMPCLHGGRCVAPYKCACRRGYTGFRCEEAVCTQPCKNGGRCFQPDRCRCPFGYSGPVCEK
ncbi:hypothetical protein EGW08_009805, partial [Elysia chlorotica]